MTAAGALALAASAVGLAALRWTPVLALALLLAGRRGTSARQRHAVWAAALLALALMVPASGLLPRLELPVPGPVAELAATETAREPAAARGASPPGPTAGSAAEGVPAVTAARAGGPAVLAALWLAGALALAAAELLHLAATRRLVRSASALPAGFADPARAEPGAPGRRCLVAELPVPAVAGLLRPRILLPRAWLSWPRSWREAVMLHEVAHLERRDLAWQGLGRWLRVAFWFHPGVWLAVRRAATEAEAACDEQVVARGIDRLDYARVLLEVAAAARSARLPGAALGAVARPSQLGERVRRLLAPAPAGRRGRRLGGVALLMACGLAAAAANTSLSPAEGAAAPTDLPLRGVEGTGVELAGDGASAETTGGWQLRCAAGDARCAALSTAALRALDATGSPGVVLVTRVADGRVEAYAARGVRRGPQDGVPAAAPGSLAKLALAAAWWERGGGNPALPCPPSTTTSSGARVEAVASTRAEGSLAPREMLARSCNTAAAAMAAELARRHGQESLALALDPLLAEARPSAARALDWELQAVGIGPLETDPLRVAAFLHAVGGDGRTVEPWAGTRPAAAPRRLFGPATAAALRQALEAAVDHGTARGLDELQRGQAWRLTGKTATVVGAGGRVDGWFAALALDAAGRPERAVVVWLQGGGPGGARPARLALEVARAAKG